MFEHILSHYAKALNSYNRLIKDHSTPELYYCRALIYIDKANNAAVIEDLNQCINSLYTEEAFFNRGLAKFYLGKYNGALHDLKQALKLNPYNENAHVIQSVICKCKSEQDWQKAQKKKI